MKNEKIRRRIILTGEYIILSVVGLLYIPYQIVLYLISPLEWLINKKSFIETIKENSLIYKLFTGEQDECE